MFGVSGLNITRVDGVRRVKKANDNSAKFVNGYKRVNGRQ